MRFHPPNAESEAAARAAAAKAAEEAARRRRESGTQQWPGVTSHSDVPVFGDPSPRVRKVQRRRRLDAHRRAHCQEHLRLARAAFPEIQPGHRPPRSDSRRRP